MSKRFPIPDFDRDQYKNKPWSPAALISDAQHKQLTQAGAASDSQSVGVYCVAVPAAFAQQFALKGEHLHALMCILPKGGAHVVGRSWAWPIQRALVVDNLSGASTKTLIDWTTPRPMNTRLGPQDGADLPGGVVYVVFANRYGQEWIGNRSLSQPQASGGGVELMSACGDEGNDFHACNLQLRWAA